MQWTSETKAIIDKHNKDFNVNTYASKIKAAGGYNAYVKGLGGVFSKMHNVINTPKTASEFRDQCEYICGMMAVWGFDYWNGKTRHRWGGGSSDAFYPTASKVKCNGGSINDLCQGVSGKSRITNCNYGVNTLLRHMSLYKTASENFGTWGSKYGKAVTSKAALKPGDMVHFFTKSITKSKPSAWKGKGWKHIAIVVKVESGKVWFADFGSRFINSRNPYHYMPVDSSSKAGGEYGSYYWGAVHAFSFPETAAPAPTPEKKEESSLIRKNTGFRGYNVSPRTVKPKYIVIHYTGSEGSASSNVEYFNTGNRDASADIFIGHQGEILAYNNDIAHQYTWHCGGSIESAFHPFYGVCTNANSIGIELCTHKDGDRWTFTGSTISSAVTLVKHLMSVYGIDADHVIRHYDVTGKACPRVSGWGAVGGSAEWEKFKAKLKEEVIPVPKTIKIGSTGKAVKWLQIYLGGLTVDGKFGKKTRDALVKKQKAWGTAAVGAPDGVCGPKTWRKILSTMG